MKTKAAVLYEHNKPLIVEEVNLDPPKPGEVLVRVAAAGICRSDLHFIHGEEYIKLPAVLGHEGAGIVEQVGDGVTLVQVGDHVIFSFAPNCAGFLRPKVHCGSYIFKNLSLANEISLSRQVKPTYAEQKSTAEITF